MPRDEFEDAFSVCSRLCNRRLIVVTGAPHTGKTEVIRALQQLKGGGYHLDLNEILDRSFRAVDIAELKTMILDYIDRLLLETAGGRHEIYVR